MYVDKIKMPFVFHKYGQGDKCQYFIGKCHWILKVAENAYSRLGQKRGRDTFAQIKLLEMYEI